MHSVALIQCCAGIVIKVLHLCTNIWALESHLRISALQMTHCAAWIPACTYRECCHLDLWLYLSDCSATHNAALGILLLSSCCICLGCFLISPLLPLFPCPIACICIS